MLARPLCFKTVFRHIVLSSSIPRNIINQFTSHEFFRFFSTSFSHDQSIFTISTLSTSDVNCYPQRLFSISSCRSSPVVQFKLADIGEGIREVEIIEWYVEVGDNVKQFDKICEVQSDKANVTIISRYGGTIVKLHQNDGKTAKVGEPLVDIKLEQDLDVLTGTKTATIMSEDPYDNTVYNKSLSANILVTPAIRQMAKELHIPLNEVQGTGKDGRILKEDLIRFKAARSTPSKNLSKIPPLSPTTVRQARTFRPVPITASTGIKKISDRSLIKSTTEKNDSVHRINPNMVRTISQTNSVPCFTYCDEYDMTQLAKLRKELKSRLGNKQKVSYMPFIIKACSQALLDYPILNSYVDSNCENIIYKASHNIGIVINTKAGVLVPNIKNVQHLSLSEITNELDRLQKLAQNGKLSREDLASGTFSLSNIGSIGGTYNIPVLHKPEVVIGTLGKICRQIVPHENYDISSDNNDADDEQTASSSLRSMISVSWSADHRVIDGATMARFSNRLKFLLENPLHILIN